MQSLRKSIKPVIESAYPNLTPVERLVADFFLADRSKSDYPAQEVADRLHVSIASLTRFAQKCGYSGYREFIYDFQQMQNPVTHINDRLTRHVLASYEELLNKTYSVIDEEQLDRIARSLLQSQRVFIYGKGSSGLAAQELKLRLMRLGVICEAITDNDVMKINTALVDADCLLLGLSLSSTTNVVLETMRQASLRGAKTVLITANIDAVEQSFIDEVVLVALSNGLSKGDKISPQLPLLLMLDILYAHFKELIDREELFEETVQAIGFWREREY